MECKNIVRQVETMGIFTHWQMMFEWNSCQNTCFSNVCLLRGAHVPRSFDEFGDLIAAVHKALVEAGAIVVANEPPVPKLPSDYDALKKKGLVRKPANFVCSISDDRGPEPTYAGVPISEIAKDEQLGVGGAISLLWFRQGL